MARTVNKTEWQREPAARKAEDDEWNKHFRNGVFDLDHPVEWGVIARKARESDSGDVHVGRVFPVKGE